MANTTADKLALAAANKVAIKAAIAAKNPTTAPTDVMSQWPTAIASIPSGGEECPEEYTGNDTEIDYDFTIPQFQWVKPIAHLNIALQSGASVRIDWGDGNVEQLTTTDQNTSTDHEYAVRGKYTLKIITDVPNRDGYGFHSRYTQLLLNNQIYGNVITEKQFEAVAFVTAVRLGPYGDVNMIASHMPSIRILQLNAHEGLGLGGNGSYPIVGDGRVNKLQFVTYGTRGNIRAFVRSNALKGFRLNSVSMLDQSIRFSSMFKGCYSLGAVPAVLDVSSGTNFSGMFNSCYSLGAVPAVLDVSSGTNFSSMFNSCYSLGAVPAVLDVSSGTNFSSMFSYCGTLRMPLVFVINKQLTSAQTIDFSTCNRIRPESLAEFDESGNIVGGFASFPEVPETYGVIEENCPDYYKNQDGTWKPHASAGKTSDATGASAQWTMKFSAAFKDMFSADEQTAIQSAMTAHGWTLTW